MILGGGGRLPYYCFLFVWREYTIVVDNGVASCFNLAGREGGWKNNGLMTHPPLPQLELPQAQVVTTPLGQWEAKSEHL